MGRKMALDEAIVKYIFPGVHPTVALGEDGYIVYDFDSFYPEKLAIFVPIEVERSNYSNVFPKSFEDYFKNLDLEISRLSLLLEMGDIFRRFPPTEFIAGQVLRREDSQYTVFRFDELAASKEKTELLCRSQASRILPSELGEIYKLSKGFLPEMVYLPGEKEYLYWFLPVKKLYDSKRKMPEKLIPMILESLSR